jgi:hypothetical protein
MKKINVIILLACSMGVVAQAQIIDTLVGRNTASGNLIGYTPYMVLENSLGAGRGVIFPSGLTANYVGTGTTAEQALFLAPLNSFSTTYAVGDRLTVNVAMPVSSIAMDFGLAIAANNPIAASGPSYDSRSLFDWASISVRPSQTSIRANSSISGALVTGNGVLSAAPNTVSKLFIDWNSANLFTMGYIDTNSVVHVSETILFSGASTIGADIGFYGDLRATGTTLGNFSNLAISAIPVPEPTSLAICGLGGFLGLVGWMRRKK